MEAVGNEKGIHRIRALDYSTFRPCHPVGDRFFPRIHPLLSPLPRLRRVGYISCHAVAAASASIGRIVEVTSFIEAAVDIVVSVMGATVRATIIVAVEAIVASPRRVVGKA